LFAVPFDVQSLKTAGSVVPLVAGVMRSELGGAAHYAFADNGTLIYLPGPASPRWDLAIADRSGQIAPLQLPSRPYEAPRASPDGTRIAMQSMEGDQWAIYVYDLSRRSALRRLTYEGNNRMPVWTSGGERIAFQSDREGDHAIFLQRADGNGTAERLTKPEKDEMHEPEAWSEANGTLLFTVRKGPSVSLWMFSSRTRKATPFGNVQSLALTGAVFSPDSKWVAYAATEAERRATIYVQPFPPTGIRHQLLREGEEPASSRWIATQQEADDDLLWYGKEMPLTGAPPPDSPQRLRIWRRDRASGWSRHEFSRRAGSNNLWRACSSPLRHKASQAVICAESGITSLTVARK